MNVINTLNSEIKFLCHDKFNYPLNWFEFKFCPCCESENISFFCTKFEMKYFLCKKCKFVFLNPTPTKEMLHELYNSAYYNSLRDRIEIPKAKKEQKNASNSVSFDDYDDIILKSLNYIDRGNWLDIGGGIGSFLYRVKQKTNRFNLFLNESNESSCQFARTHYKLNVISENIDDIVLSKVKFNVISLLSVIEHVPSPIDFLIKCIGILDKNGILILNTPRFSFFNRILSKEASFNVIPPYHVSLFNEKNLNFGIIRNCSLNLKEIWFTGQNAFSFIDLLHISEKCDVKIPMEEAKELEVMSEVKFKYNEKILYSFLNQIDKRTKRIVGKTDGKGMINLIFLKNEKH